MSNYVVIARFDDITDKRINKFRMSFIDTGYSVSDWPVHITISAYENIDETLICDWTEEFCKSHKSVNVNLCSLGNFHQIRIPMFYILLPHIQKHL